MLYDKCLEQIQTLFAYVKTHLGDDFDYKTDVEKMLDDSKDKWYLLDSAFIVICYIISNSDYKNIITSFSIRDFDFGQLNRDLLELMYDYYSKNYAGETTSPESIFPDECDLFTSCNTTLLQPSIDIVSKPPDKAKVVKFHINNCRNMVFDIKSILDDEYIKSQFSSINSNTGVNSLIIDRFRFLKDFEPGKPTKDSDFIIDEDTNVYQQLDDGHYRALTNNPIQEKDYKLINSNLAVTNWENKRILAMRQTIPKPPRSLNADMIKGNIKNNIYVKNTSVGDAVFSAYYNANMSDNDALQIAIGAHMYQDKLPRHIKSTDFDKFFSIRDMESNIL